MKHQHIITSIDIGTTKICTIIAQVTEDRLLEIRGMGVVESAGLDKGIVKDIARASESIRKSIRFAEEEAGIPAQNIYAGIAGEHIKSQNASGRISLSNSSTRQEPTEIAKEHVDQVINEAQGSVQLQANQNLEIIHAIPQYFDIDEHKGILNPVAMSGFQLTAHVHVVMANISALRNIQKCIQLAGYQVTEIVLEPIASAKAVLNEDEQDLGCILIDIGGGTTDIAVFYKNSIRFTCIKPLGGASITHDLAIGLRTPLAYAESIKLKNGNALASKVSDDEIIRIEAIGGRDVSENKLNVVAQIIEYRMRETLEISYKAVINSYHQDLMTAGVVLTGGTSLLRNIDKLAYQVFNLPVKIGYPILNRFAVKNPQLNNPKYATAIGLLYYGLDTLPRQDDNHKGAKRKKSEGPGVSEKFAGAFKRIIKVISENI